MRCRTAARMFGSSSSSCDDRLGLAAPAQIGGESVDEAREVVRVRGAHALRVAALLQPADRVLAHEREERERRHARRHSLCFTREPSTSALERVDGLTVPGSPRADRFDGFEAEPGREHAEVFQQVALERRGADSRSSRSSPASCGAVRAGLVPPRSAAAGSGSSRSAMPAGVSRRIARRRELDRQRQSLEPAADVGDVRGVLGCHLESLLDRLGPVDEQGDRGRAGRAAAGSPARRRAVSRSRSTSYTRSPRIRSTIRLVTRNAGLRDDRRTAATSVGAASTICSKLSSTISTRRSSSARGEPLDEAGFAAVPDAESRRDRRHQQMLVEHRLQRHEVDAVRKEVGRGARGLDREPALADPPGADEGDHTIDAPAPEAPALRRCRARARSWACSARAAERRDEAGVLVVRALAAGAGLIEALGEQRREVVGEALLQLRGGLEGEVGGGVVLADAARAARRAAGSRCRARLDVDELRHRPRREVVLVLEPRHLLVGGDPAVALPVDARRRRRSARGRSGTAREADAAGRPARTSPARGACARSQRARRAPLVCEFAQSRAHEHPDPLVGSADRGVLNPSHGNIMALSRGLSPQFARNSGRGAWLYRSIRNSSRIGLDTARHSAV